MNIDTHIIERYINGQPPYAKEDAWMPIERVDLAANRQEVAAELMKRTRALCAQFPTFNAALFHALFPQLETTLSHIDVILLVGSKELCHLHHDKTRCVLFLDLIRAADMTHIVSQMMYLIHNALHYEIAKHCLLSAYPDDVNDFIQRLNHLCFIEGFATYLSWNAHAADYRLFTDRYEAQKIQAFGMLHQALSIEDASLQKAILAALPSLPFWEQFPTIAALFYLDDCYRSEGESGLCRLYAQGWEQFTQTMFAL